MYPSKKVNNTVPFEFHFTKGDTEMTNFDNYANYSSPEWVDSEVSRGMSLYTVLPSSYIYTLNDVARYIIAMY